MTWIADQVKAAADDLNSIIDTTPRLHRFRPDEVPAGQMTFVYDGAVQGECSMCGRKVWIGPRQQEWWVIGTPALCFLCAVTVAGADNIHSLGNPQPNPNA